MARTPYRPTTMVDYGGVVNAGSGNIMGDGNDLTGKAYQNPGGSIGVWPVFNPASIPIGRVVLAVRIAHRQYNGGAFNVYNGWCGSYLRINNVRVEQTYNYTQDGFSTSTREIVGPPLYKGPASYWTVSDLSKMGGDIGAVVGPIGPITSNEWCAATELFIYVVTDEDTPVPTVPYPANAAVIATSSVDFSAQIPAVQTEQPVRAVFQVARNNTFTSDVRTFVGGLNALETGTSRSYYDSVSGQPSHTNLGPGLWYLRMKGRDYRGVESAWGATTSFTITHTALPVPTLLAPNPGVISPNPYALRVANIPTQPSGERRVGVEWSFSKSPVYASGVVAWANQQSAIFTAGNVQYNPQPDPSTAPGLNGPNVSLEDPDQRLSQGHWYARVRCIDVYGQVGDWSSNFEFDVSHIPVVADPLPALDIAFDEEEQLVTWRFTDPWSGDLQSAYRIKVYDLTDNLLFDSGKVLNASPRGAMDVVGHMQDHMKYSLEIWDLDDVKSTSLATNAFFKSAVPVITLPFPAEGEAIVSGQPSISWSSVFSRVGVTQKSYRLIYRQADNASLIYDTGTIVTATATHIPPRPILKNQTGYQISLTITDTDNLPKTLLRNFTTNFVRPDGVLAFADATPYQQLGYVDVTWAADPDPFFAEWRIYRRKVTDPVSEFEYVGKVEDPDLFDFHDWTIAGSADFEYSVTQAAYRFGSLVESAFEEYPVAIRIESDNYWLITPDDETRNVKLHSVHAEKFTQKKQQNSYVIIDGGMRVNQGPQIGKEGSLSCSVRQSAGKTATEQLEFLRSIDTYKGWVMMRDPFGNVTKISLGEIGVDRIAGVGNQEFADLEIPYVEVR